MADERLIQQTDAEELEMKPIDKWDCSAVKNRLDDGVKYYFINDRDYEEQFIMIDIRLGISLVAVLIALYALAWDFINPFPASRPVLAVCVLAYFAMMGVLTFYTAFIEKGIFVKGTKNNKKITVSSYMKRFDDRYRLIVSLSDTKTGRVVEEQLENSVAEWFDSKGNFLYKKFDAELNKLNQKLNSESKKKTN